MAHVNNRVAIGPRHLRIDLRDHQLGTVHRRSNDVDARSQTDVAVLVRGAHLDERHVDTDFARADEPRDLRQEHRHEVGAALLNRLPHVGADEEGGVAKTPLQARLDVGRVTESQQVDDFVVG